MKRYVYLLLVFAMAFSLVGAGLAQERGFQPTGDVSAESSFSLDAEKVSPQAKGVVDPREFRLISVIVTFKEGQEPANLESLTGGRTIYRYSKIFNGASMVLPGESVSILADLPGVDKVYLDELNQPDTDVTPTFIKATDLWAKLGGPESAGEGTIVGVLDTGIWPEHPSFSDPDPSGKPFPAPPVLPGSNGFGSRGAKNTCDFGNTAWNPDDAPFTCNNKLIGAYNFLDTYKAVYGLAANEFDSARDDDGHGTHTTSTAAGNYAVPSTLLGVSRGNVSGIAPRAHVIMYRVCAAAGCYSSDSAAATEQAILDGVDSINFSISGGNAPYSDAVSLAFLAAYDSGVFVSASAGNSGPGANTVSHREPWTTTVAASTSNRHFVSTLTLVADNAETLVVTGASVTDGIFAPTAVIFPPAGEELCLDAFAPGTFSGEIVICERGVIARVEKSYNVMAGGASGMILYNPALQGESTDNHFIPSVHIDGPAGVLLLDFMATHTGVTGTFTPGVATKVKGDVMASFSSRGGTGQTLGVSKPDVTAPGVQILAGHTPLPSSVEGGLPGELFQAIQGTSMSSPHVAGSAALLADLNPSWTPGQIRSALMTTSTQSVLKEDGVTQATPFDMGSGRINLKRAAKPGLTFDAPAIDYVTLQNQLWNANYPSLFVPVMPGQITVSRTVQSTFGFGVNWTLTVLKPADLKVKVPSSFYVAGGAARSFNITVDASKVPLGEVRHATLYLTSAYNTLAFPITIIRRQPVVTLAKTCTPDTLPVGGLTDCTITATNTTFNDALVNINDTLPAALKLVGWSLTGATQTDYNALNFSGTLAGAEPPLVTIDDGISPAGYLPLSLFGVAPFASSDEAIANFTVPAFTYAGVSYSRIGIVSNGYVVVGGGDTGDVNYINQNLPNTGRPNNVLAPFWTDLNPGAGGALRIGTLTDGVDTWIVVDFAAVPNYSSGAPNDFQVWIRTGTVEDITFTYGPSITTGDGGFLTVGAENVYGNSGENYYYNGVGTAPVASTTELRVSSVPGAPGETHTINFLAKGIKALKWTNCALMTSDLFQGTNVACFSGVVTP